MTDYVASLSRGTKWSFHGYIARVLIPTKPESLPGFTSSELYRMRATCRLDAVIIPPKSVVRSHTTLTRKISEEYR